MVKNQWRGFVVASVLDDQAMWLGGLEYWSLEGDLIVKVERRARSRHWEWNESSSINAVLSRGIHGYACVWGDYGKPSYLNACTMTNIRANIWESKRGAPIKSNVIVEPFNDVCLPMSRKLLHPESYCIWVSFPGTSTVALSKITLAVGIYSMRSSRKGASVEPDAVTVRLVGVVVDIFCKAQSSQLFRLIPGIVDELMANPLIKQLQDGVADAWMLGKLPITDILEPVVKRELNNSSRLWHEILTYPWNWRKNSQMPLTHGGYCWRVPRRLYQKN